MADHIAGKVIVITGAGSGFGKRTAEIAGSRGARVFCADINGDAAEAVAASIRDGGGSAQALAVDVTRIEDMRAMASAAVEAFGAIDVLVNSAGTMPLAFLADHETALDAWTRCIDINFKGVMNGTVAVHDQMMAQGSGHIVNLSSIYGNHPVVGSAVYGATKAAVNYFSHSVRQESRGVIKVTVVKPTGVPSTGLGASVVNVAGSVGILGHNAGAFQAQYLTIKEGTAGASMFDRDSLDYFALDAEDIATSIIHVIDQPAGVTISDITVRATGDLFIL